MVEIRKRWRLNRLLCITHFCYLYNQKKLTSLTLLGASDCQATHIDDQKLQKVNNMQRLWATTCETTVLEGKRQNLQGSMWSQWQQSMALIDMRAFSAHTNCTEKFHQCIEKASYIRQATISPLCRLLQNYWTSKCHIQNVYMMFCCPISVAEQQKTDRKIKFN